MISTLGVALGTTVITIYSLFRLFIHVEVTFVSLSLAFSNVLWDVTVTAPICIAIRMSAKINRLVRSGKFCASAKTNPFLHLSLFRIRMDE